jgi:gentisate 1,2-dioxygenase
VPWVWHWRDLRPQAMRAAQLVGTEQAERRVLNTAVGGGTMTLQEAQDIIQTGW